MFVAQGLHGGGAEVVVRRWAGRLAELGHQVDVVTTDPTLEDRQLESGITRFRMRRSSIARKAVGLRKLIVRRQPDVVMSHLTRLNVLVLGCVLAVNRAHRPVIAIEEHNVLTIMSSGSLTGYVGRAVARFLYPRADISFAVSRAVASDLLQYGVDATRIVRAYNPVLESPHSAPYDRYLSTAIHNTGGNGEPGQGSNTITIVLPMRLVPQKQPMRAVLTARELRDRGHSIRLVFLGRGPLQEEIKRTGRREGVDVTFMGWVDSWQSACEPDDVVLLPSKVEGLGNVLIEAASAGLRSVAPRTALGVTDAILPGRTGRLASSADPTDLADAVELVLDDAPPDPCHDPETAAWLDRYTVERSTDELLRALSNTLAKHKTRIKCSEN